MTIKLESTRELKVLKETSAMIIYEMRSSKEYRKFSWLDVFRSGSLTKGVIMLSFYKAKGFFGMLCLWVAILKTSRFSVSNLSAYLVVRQVHEEPVGEDKISRLRWYVQVWGGDVGTQKSHVFILAIHLLVLFMGQNRTSGTRFRYMKSIVQHGHDLYTQM